MPKLSIDTDIVERYACGYSMQERKKRMELLSFAIFCKIQHSNSVMFNRSIREWKSLLGIGQAKAKMLLKAKDDDLLFENLDNDRFRILTFRDKTVKCDKKGKPYKGCHVFTLRFKRSCKLKDIYNKLNELLFLRQIGAKEANDCKKGSKPLGKCHSSFITMKQFQGAVGMSHGSCCGIKKRLLQKKQIHSTIAELHMADNRCDGQVENLLRRFGRENPSFVQGHSVYVCIPCSYSITNRKAKDSCGRFKIYDYSKRAALTIMVRSIKSDAGVFAPRGGKFLPIDGRLD